ncbi:hypothetical protein ADM99_07780 [Leptolinea tardivitalis]|uniref:Uncharacterized protein n=2 Tax=Leptolinea tardivitalis TaxID=229920 RepID=A0A0P6XU20_9CHLR|nr:hypothetical protein ADM99_07780 [Leptolinea tardivitalis]
MNRRRPASTESNINLSSREIHEKFSVILDELSPFGVFISQFIYMAGWFFPGNQLPKSWQRTAEYLEKAGEAEGTHDLY